MTRSRRSTFAVLVTTAVLMAACSSGGGGTGTTPKSVLGDVARATAAGHSGRITGRVSVGGAADALSGRWSGATIDAGSGEAGISVGAAATLRLRWAAGTVYGRRDGDLPATFPASISSLVTSIDPGRWRALPVSPISDAVVTPFSPPALVRYLAQHGVVGRSQAGPRISGTPTRHITVKGTGLLFAWSGLGVDLWVDGHDRVVRVGIGTKAEGMQYDVSYRSVAPVSTPDSLAVPSTAPTSFRPVGPYATIASGQSDAVTWRVLQAPGSDGRQCWRAEMTPPIVVRKPNGPDGARCALPPQPDDEPEQRVEFMILTDGSAPFTILAARVPAGSQAVIGFVGSHQVFPMNVTGEVAVWAGPTDPAPGYVGVQFPDGTKLDCGVGAISTADDLTDGSLAPEPYALPWGCLSE